MTVVNLAAESVKQPMLQNKQIEQIQPPVDMEHLGRFTMKDRDLEHEILDLFVETLVQSVKTLAETQDQKTWNMAAHTLKGSARAIGAWNLAQLMERAEKLVIGTSMEQIRQEMLDDLEIRAASVKSFISDLSAHA